jgi:hypothetical protein
LTDYRVVTNGETWRVQWHGWFFWHWLKEWVPVAYADYHRIWEFESAHEACAKVRELREEGDRQARIKAHGWQKRNCA